MQDHFKVHVLTMTAGGRLREIKSEAAVGPALVAGAEPALRKFQAIWDTGATSSCISQAVVDACGLTPIGMAQMHTAAGTQTTPVFLICIRLPGGVGFNPLRVSLVALTGADVLIGMDVIAQGDFALTNLGGKTMFSFRYPSLEHIDFHTPLKAAMVNGSGVKAAPQLALPHNGAATGQTRAGPGINPTLNRKQRRAAANRKG